MGKPFSVKRIISAALIIIVFVTASVLLLRVFNPPLRTEISESQKIGQIYVELEKDWPKIIENEKLRAKVENLKSKDFYKTRLSIYLKSGTNIDEQKKFTKILASIADVTYVESFTEEENQAIFTTLINHQSEFNGKIKLVDPNASYILPSVEVLGNFPSTNTGLEETITNNKFVEKTQRRGNPCVVDFWFPNKSTPDFCSTS